MFYDFFMVHSLKWYLGNNGYPSARSKITGKIVLMHGALVPPIKGLHVDHINRDKLDNRQVNLHQVTVSENTRNSKDTKHSSQYRHVTVRPGVNITAQVGNTHLGTFKTEEEAYDAACKFKRKAFGLLLPQTTGPAV